jgi:hypothetical protein
MKEPIKQFSCCDGHQFDHEEVKEWYNGRSTCPFCWPAGFRNNQEKKTQILTDYFAPPWQMTPENADKTFGWIEFQRLARLEPKYYSELFKI